MGRFLLVLAAFCLLTSAGAAPFENTMAQRTAACTICHGKEGRAGPDGYYPRIAGKPEGYLYNQLLNFRDGRRHYALMTRLLDPLSDAYLLEIAQYFASLDLPYAAPAPSAAPQDLLRRGELLAKVGTGRPDAPACTQCHGTSLTGVQPNTPGLLGLSRDYLSAQMGAWRTGQRRAHAPDCMAKIAKSLTPEELTSVIAWLSSQPVAAGGKPAPALGTSSASMACGSAALPAGRQVP